MNRYLKLILSSIAAGAIMALCSFELVMMVSVDQFVAGGFIQGFGLAAILALNLDLFNGHVVDVFKRENKDKILNCLFDNLIRITFNIATIVALGFLLRACFLNNQKVLDAGYSIASKRFISILGFSGSPWYTPFIKSMMCGIIVASGGLIASKIKNEFLKATIIFLSVGIYVVCGFEQIMTNSFYLSFANSINVMTFIESIFVIVGNSVGAILVFLFSNAIKK